MASRFPEATARTLSAAAVVEARAVARGKAVDAVREHKVAGADLVASKVEAPERVVQANAVPEQEANAGNKAATDHAAHKLQSQSQPTSFSSHCQHNKGRAVRDVVNKAAQARAVAVRVAVVDKAVAVHRVDLAAVAQVAAADSRFTSHRKC